VYCGAEGAVEEVEGVGVGVAMVEGEVMVAEEIGVEDEVLEDAGAGEADVDSSVLVLDSEGVAGADVVD
jgi:hypothetical protein